MDIDELIPRVRTYARAVPDPTAIRAIIVATQELCQRTHIWKENDTITITDPTGESITVSQDARVIAIYQAFLDDMELKPATETQLDAINPTWSFDTDINEASARYIVAPAPDLIRIWPPQAGTLKARFVLEPTEAAETLPDLLRAHAETIALGASANAMMMPRTDFFNPDLASVNAGRFRDAIDTLMMRNFRSTVRARPRTTSRYF